MPSSIDDDLEMLRMESSFVGVSLPLFPFLNVKSPGPRGQAFIAKGIPDMPSSIDDDLEKLRMESSMVGVSLHSVTTEDDEDFGQHCFLSARLARSVRLPEMSAAELPGGKGWFQWAQ